MGRTVTVVGLGNIGSHLAPHLARLPGLSRVLLVDKGRYDDTNIRSQAVTASQVGRSKAQVQGLQLKRINPALGVAAIAGPVEAIPLGRLRADVILACVDSRAARQYLNQAARRLGVPLVDAGVQPEGSLVRVSVFRPGDAHACLECTWDQADYDAIEQTYPCGVDGGDGAPTGAPAHLGALAAAVQAFECQRLLEASIGQADGSYEIVIGAAAHRYQVTRFARNRACRLPDHEAWAVRTIRRPPRELSAVEALALGGSTTADGGACLRLDGVPFIVALTCLGCGRRTPSWRLRRAITGRETVCRFCGGRLEAAGPDLVAALASDSTPAKTLARSLEAFGFQRGDIFSIGGDGETRFYELTGAPVRRASD